MAAVRRPPLDALLVGAAVAVTLADGGSFRSVVFGVDEARDVAVFRQSPEHTYIKGNYRVVPLASIASVEALGAGVTPLMTLPDPSAGPSRYARAAEAEMIFRERWSVTRGAFLFGARESESRRMTGRQGREHAGGVGLLPRFYLSFAPSFVALVLVSFSPLLFCTLHHRP
jgi:hypothetical protein